NRTKDVSGATVIWLKVKEFQYRQAEKNKTFISYDYSSDYKMVDVRGVRRRSATSVPVPNIQPAYNQQLSISTLKNQDLLQICLQMVIHEELHGWFQSLPTTNGTKD
ncbi:hypothetical protein EGW08_008677, partial [Elysia chlorotica]